MSGILIVDKPEGFTSHDVVAKLRGILRERRIGHAGTLDPMATGVLLVFVGRATRAVQFAESQEKEYIAGLRTGLVTTTADITGEIISSGGIKPEKFDVLAVLPQFTGELLQTPPMYSAVKVGGERLYKLARRGESVERKPRCINIREIELMREENGDFFLRVVCSKGTYIRTLCEEIGEKLGCGACMSYLRRTRSGGYGIENAKTLTDIEEAAACGEAADLFITVDSLFADKPALTIDAAQTAGIRNGAVLDVAAPDGKYRIYAPNGEFLALSELRGKKLRTIKSFYEV